MTFTFTQNSALSMSSTPPDAAAELRICVACGHAGQTWAGVVPAVRTLFDMLLLSLYEYHTYSALWMQYNASIVPYSPSQISHDTF